MGRGCVMYMGRLEKINLCFYNIFQRSKPCTLLLGRLRSRIQEYLIIFPNDFSIFLCKDSSSRPFEPIASASLKVVFDVAEDHDFAGVHAKWEDL